MNVQTVVLLMSSKAHPEIFAFRNESYKWLNMLLWENEALRSNLGFLAAGCMLVDLFTLGSAGAGMAYKIKCQSIYHSSSVSK